MPPVLRKRKGGQVAATAAPISDNNTVAKEPVSNKKLPVRAKDGEAGAKSAAAAEDGSKTGTLKVFNNEDEDVAVSAATPLRSSKIATPAVVADSEAGDSEDDDAPEAISTQHAASEVKRTSQAAQKAAQKEAADEKRKRQQRDKLFKEQAEQRKKALKVTEAPTDADKAIASASATTALAEEGADPQSGLQVTTGPQPSRKRSRKLAIPDVLPAEYLDSSSDEEEEEEANDVNVALPKTKKRKVSKIEKDLTRQAKGPRDEIVGTTLYRIAGKTDDRLAPKASKHAAGVKGALLTRNRQPVKGRSGFFTKK